MGILVTGATGTIGSQVLAHLAGQAIEVRALTRSPETAKLPAGITPIGGDLAEVDSLRAAMKGVDTLFLLNDVLHFDRYGNLPGFADASADVIEAVLREAAKFSEEVLTPLNRIGDKEGCTRHADGSVTTPTGFKDAYKQIIDGGWVGISVPTEYGGQDLPATITIAVNELLCSANMAFAMAAYAVWNCWPPFVIM